MGCWWGEEKSEIRNKSEMCELRETVGTHACECGYYGDPKRECRCSPREVQRYRQRISGPLLDRIDIHVEVPAAGLNGLCGFKSRDGSSAAAEFVRLNTHALQHGDEEIA